MKPEERARIQVCPACKIPFICDRCKTCDYASMKDCECFECRPEDVSREMTCGQMHLLKEADMRERFVFR